MPWDYFGLTNFGQQERIYFIKQGAGTKEILTYSTGLQILCFSVGGTDMGDQAVVIVSGREWLAEKLQVVP
jgi:hypothetical protein